MHDEQETWWEPTMSYRGYDYRIRYTMYGYIGGVRAPGDMFFKGVELARNTPESLQEDIHKLIDQREEKGALCVMQYRGMTITVRSAGNTTWGVNLTVERTMPGSEVILCTDLYHDGIVLSAVDEAARMIDQFITEQAPDWAVIE